MTPQQQADQIIGTPITRAALVYQAGIANVFQIDRFQPAPNRQIRRLYQGDFYTAAAIARGLELAGVEIKTYACNMAGDIALQPWSEDLDAAPWSEKFVRFPHAPR